MKINHKPKILVVVGPTSSGKSELAVAMAKKYNGEIISADSRQIYRDMNIGTGKVPGRWISQRPKNPPINPLTYKTHGRAFYMYKGIVHHCIDYVNPKKQYSVAFFKRDAQKAVADILGRNKLPIICGGTAHWIDAVVFNQNLPDVKPNPALRKRLERLTSEELFARIVAKDPARAKTIDPSNRRRLIRALEIIESTGQPVPNLKIHDKKSSPYNALWIGTMLPQAELYKKIEKRLKQRIKGGMTKEVKLLRFPPQKMGRDKGRGLSWHRLIDFGLEYRFVALYLQKKISRDEMFTQLLNAIKHYAKRQMTWWKRNKEIVWIKPEVLKAQNLVTNFLK